MLTGIVMCGGKSSRMGTDKGLLQKNKQTWAELAYDKIKSLNIPTNVSINASQIESYQQLFNKNELIVDNVNLPGPLAGLFSAFHKLKNEDLLLLACDMTDISTNTIQNLINTYTTNKKEYDFFIFKNQEEHEPLLGIYSHKGIQRIHDFYTGGKLKKYSMKYCIEISNTFSILLNDTQKAEFKNYNEPFL
jgi:molybdopterin-guanine dinucleotide biosynthesis protein A